MDKLLTPFGRQLPSPSRTTPTGPPDEIAVGLGLPRQPQAPRLGNWQSHRCLASSVGITYTLVGRGQAKRTHQVIVGEALVYRLEHLAKGRSIICRNSLR